MPSKFIAALLSVLMAWSQQTNYADGLYVEVKTNKGLIVLQLEFEKTPMTVSSFVGLAEGVIENKALPLGTPFFDGTVFHRVVPGHVIQAGQAKAAITAPGYTFPNEIDSSLSHGREGMLGMANSGPHTNASQFYITLGDRSYLDGNYTVFGYVIRGMDVVNAIVQGDVVETIRIVRVGKAAANFKPNTESFQEMADAARARVKADDEKKSRDEEAAIAKNWPNAVASPNGTRVIVIRDGSGTLPTNGSKIKAIYSGHYLDGRPFSSSANEGRPIPGSQPEAFDYGVGTTKTTPALDEALAGMKQGERRTVIAQGALAYGTAGFYAREKPGDKRFVISPNTTLVYEVERIN
jgi:cyclophilin family peptidyl-prolyl cis-trans isomerase